MPTITLNKAVFDELIGKILSLDELKEKIPMLGTDLERIDNKEIVVEVFPNRPDMLSEQGFARAFSSFIGEKTGLKKYKIQTSHKKVIIEDSVKGVRPFTACAIVKGMNFDDEKIKEIIEIQEKLHITYGRNRRKVAIGIYPFEKITPPIRYLAMDPKDIKFQPLESTFEMDGNEILEKHPKGKEYAYLLEGKKNFPIFIDANEKILSMPPIINSHDVGKINESTKDVFIECSGFDFNSIKIALNILVTTMSDMGGNIYSMELDYSGKKEITPNLEPSTMLLKTDYVNKILGTNLNENEIKKYLERMGMEYKKGKVLVPGYRSDILHEIDLVEEIAIAYGYTNFKEEIPNVATIADEDNFYKFKEKIANLLIGLGLLETNSYSLTNHKKLNERMELNLKYVEIENPNSSEYTCLRTWIVPSLLEILSTNKHNEFPQNIFEIGRIFKKGETETGIDEPTRLGVLISHKDVDFTEAKRILNSIFRLIGLSSEIRETDHPSFLPGRVGRISVKETDIAYIGEIHPKVLSNWDLEMPVSGFELNLTELYKLIEK